MRALAHERRPARRAATHHSSAAWPRSLRVALTAAFLVTAAGLASTTTIPLVATAMQVRELIRLGDDHAEAVEVLSRLRGSFSSVRSTLVRIAAQDPSASPAEIENAFRATRDRLAELVPFADTPTERRGLGELRADVERIASDARRAQMHMSSGDERAALAEIPWVVAEIGATDATAQRLVTFNAAEVQSSARRLRESLWRVATFCVLLAGVGLGPRSSS